MLKSVALPTIALSLALLSGCSQSNPPDAKVTAADGAKYLLAEEPAGARPVQELRQAAKDGDEVVIVGRIGGSKEPWIEGRAGFLIVDPSFTPCNEKAGEDCPTPWDYCC